MKQKTVFLLTFLLTIFLKEINTLSGRFVMFIQKLMIFEGLVVHPPYTSFNQVSCNVCFKKKEHSAPQYVQS